jgi:hypothetical protein
MLGEQIKKFQEDPKKMKFDAGAQDPPDGQPIWYG